MSDLWLQPTLKPAVMAAVPSAHAVDALAQAAVLPVEQAALAVHQAAVLTTASLLAAQAVVLLAAVAVLAVLQHQPAVHLHQHQLAALQLQPQPAVPQYRLAVLQHQSAARLSAVKLSTRKCVANSHAADVLAAAARYWQTTQRHTGRSQFGGSQSISAHSRTRHRLSPVSSFFYASFQTAGASSSQYSVRIWWGRKRFL